MQSRETVPWALMADTAKVALRIAGDDRMKDISPAIGTVGVTVQQGTAFELSGGIQRNRAQTP